jgi:hypothetical protein
MKTCPACASSNVDNAAFCSQCGSPLDETGERGPTQQPLPLEPADEVAAPPEPQPATPAQSIAPAIRLPESPGVERGETPCLVKALGGFFGCLFGLIAGLCLSLICVMPVGFAISGGHGSSGLQVAIVVVVILVIITTLLGIATGPSFLGKIFASVGDTFKWMSGSKN